MSAERELLEEAVIRLEGIVINGGNPLHVLDAKWTGGFIERVRQLDAEPEEPSEPFVTRQELAHLLTVYDAYTSTRDHSRFLTPFDAGVERLRRGQDARDTEYDNAEANDDEA